MIIYIPLANISFPANVIMLYGILLPISSMDLIPPEISSDILFSMSIDDDQPYSAILEDMGYETHNFIYNLGSIFYFLLGIVLFMILINIIKLIIYIFKRCAQKISFRNDKYHVKNIKK